jgi:hypothetical protein
MRWRVSASPVVAIVCLSIFGVGGYSQETSFKGDVADVRVIRRLERHTDAWRLWQPYIAQWRRKHLVVAFGAMAIGKKDMGTILASVSTDDGDLIWCYAMRCPMVYPNSEDSQLVGAFSADGGRSWTPVEMAMHYSGPLILNGGLYQTEIEGQRRFLLPAHRNTLQKDPLGSRDHFILSSTSLLEWRLEAFVPQPKSGKVFLHEGNIAPGDAPGEIKMVMRTAGYEDAALTTNPPRAYSSVSKDGGHTWSTAKPEPDLYNAKSKGFFGRAKNGTQIYVYNDGLAQPAPGSRMALRYKTKPAGGVWSEEKTFFDAGIKNSYPTLIEVAPGDFRAVWDSGTSDTPRTHIHFGKFRIKQ